MDALRGEICVDRPVVMPLSPLVRMETQFPVVAG